MDIRFALYYRETERHNWHLYGIGSLSKVKQVQLPDLKAAKPKAEMAIYTYDSNVTDVCDLPSNVRDGDLNNGDVQFYEWA